MTAILDTVAPIIGCTGTTAIFSYDVVTNSDTWLLVIYFHPGVKNLPVVFLLTFVDLGKVHNRKELKGPADFTPGRIGCLLL